jgi:hypothetical protein
VALITGGALVAAGGHAAEPAAAAHVVSVPGGASDALRIRHTAPVPDAAPRPAKVARFTPDAPRVAPVPNLTGALVPCTSEDAPGPCYWDAGTAGNGVGTSWLAWHGRVWYPIPHGDTSVTFRGVTYWDSGTASE